MFPTAHSICFIQESDHKQSLLQMKDGVSPALELSYFPFIHDFCFSSSLDPDISEDYF